MSSPADPSARESPKHSTGRPFLWIILACAAAHIWCLGSQFYMDDFPQIEQSDAVRNADLWKGFALFWTRLGYIIQTKLFGPSPVGFHAVNWLLHTSVACALFAFARDFLNNQSYRNAALFGALLFAVHPLGSEIPNYARTQDLAWVTLFSLLACRALLTFLQSGGWPPLLWTALAVLAASMSKGPGIFHALMMVGAVGLAAMTRPHWTLLRRKWWIVALGVVALAAIWATATKGNIAHTIDRMHDPRFIGHGYTVARVFWEFAWRAFVPTSLCSDHQIAETLIAKDGGIFSTQDTTALWAAAGTLALTGIAIALAWRKSTRPFGVCLFLFVATMLFRVAYLIPEFMPEYRIYPGLPWFCLGIAIVLAVAWQKLLPQTTPRYAALALIALFAVISARRSFVWHDLDTLCGDVLKQYPAQARAIWELHDRDVRNNDWQKIIDRQNHLWQPTVASFVRQNQQLGPARELPTGHFALADVAC